MKKIKHQTIMEYTYDTEEERLIHIEKMELEGWKCNRSKQKRIDPNISLWDAKDSDYEWFAEFWRYGEF